MADRMTRWSWWVGSAASVEEAGVYDLNDLDTREAAIRYGARETPAGGRFYIIEARCWDREPENPDCDPFAERRHKQAFTVNANGEAVAE